MEQRIQDHQEAMDCRWVQIEEDRNKQIRQLTTAISMIDEDHNEQIGQLTTAIPMMMKDHNKQIEQLMTAISMMMKRLNFPPQLPQK